MWGLVCAGFAECTRGGVRVLERSSHGGSRLTALDAYVFEGGPSVLRWVRGVCFSLWWRGFVGGSLYLYDVEGSTRSCWTGSWVSPCAILLRRVGFWVAACCGYCSPLGMTCQWARSPLEERVYRGAGRSRRRARGDGVLVWSGVALPCLCGGSRRRVSSFEGERATASFSLGRSVAPPLVCK